MGQGNSSEEGFSAVAPASPSPPPRSFSTDAPLLSSPMSPPRFHRALSVDLSPHSHASSTLNARRRLLLYLLFQSIASSSQSDSSSFDALTDVCFTSLSRASLLLWVSREPYLQQPELRAEVSSMISQLDHDEDSQCSLKEFISSFVHVDNESLYIIMINLLRKTPPVDGHLQGKALADFAQRAARESTTLHNVTSEMITALKTSKADQRGKDTLHNESIDEIKHFLLEFLFHAMDSNVDFRLSRDDIETIVHDTFFTSTLDFQEVIHELLQMVERKEREQKEGTITTNTMVEDGTDEKKGAQPDDDVGLTRAEFHSVLMRLQLEQIQYILLHMLSRSATDTIATKEISPEKDQKERKEKLDEAAKAFRIHRAQGMKLVKGHRSLHDIFSEMTVNVSDARRISKEGESLETMQVHRTEDVNDRIAAQTSSEAVPIHPQVKVTIPPTPPSAVRSLMLDSVGSPVTTQTHTYVPVVIPPTPTAPPFLHSPSMGSPLLPLPVPPVRHLRFTSMGQVMIQHDIRKYPRGQTTLELMKNILHGGDVIFSELETSIQVDGAEAQRKTVFQHSAPATVLECVKMLNFHILACSNNHAGDLGPMGIAAILKEVGERGILCSGIGKSLSEAAEPKFLDITVKAPKKQNNHDDHLKVPIVAEDDSVVSESTLRVSISSFASKVPVGTDAQDLPEPRPGVNCLSMSDVGKQILDEGDVRRILRSISRARRHSSVVVAYHHNHYWEKNAAVNEQSPMGSWRREWAHKCIDAGATIYLAHGEPRMGGIELYRGSPIFYCLGNFIFQTKTEIGFYGPEVWEAVIVQIDYFQSSLDKEIITPKKAAHLVKVNMRNDHTVMEEDEEDESAPPPCPSYSIKLIPLQLNEVGDEPYHLETRGLPRLASREAAIRILKRIADLSAAFDTEIDIDESNPNKVIGWVLPKETKNNVVN